MAKKASRPAIMIAQPPVPATIAEWEPAIEAPTAVSAAAVSAAVEAAVEPPTPEHIAAPIVAAITPPEAAAEPATDVGASVRAFVETGIVESRARSAADDASAAVEAAFSAARDGAIALNAKAIDAVKAGASAQLDLFKAVASAQSLSQLVTLHAEFARERFVDVSSRGAELAELARKVAEDALAPLTAQVAKSLKTSI